MRARRLRRFGSLLLLVVLTILLVLELLARHFSANRVPFLENSKDPELLYQLRPGRFVSDGIFLKIAPYHVGVNEHACREALHPEDMPADGEAIRVLFIGDSFTFSQGVEAEQGYPALVAKGLTEMTQGTPYRSYNCGVPGYNFSQLVRACEIRLLEFEPSLLVFSIFSNDLQEPLYIDRAISIADHFPVGLLVNHVRMFRMLYPFVLEVLIGNMVDAPPLDPILVEKGLLRIKDAAASVDCKPVFVLIAEPSHPDVDFADLVSKHEFAWHRVPHSLMRQEKRIPFDGHWNPAGHEEMSKWLTEILVQEMDIEPK